MSTDLIELETSAPSSVEDTLPPRLSAILQSLDKWLETELTVVDVAAGRFLKRSKATVGSLPGDWIMLAREVALRHRPEFIFSDDPLLALAVPIPDGGEHRHVAVGLFLTDGGVASTANRQIERTLGWTAAEFNRWAARQQPWRLSRLLTLAESIHARLAAELKTRNLVKEGHELSANIAAMYEEISLLHRLTQHLRISESNEDLARLTLEWLEETIPAESMVLELVPGAGLDDSRSPTRGQSTFLTRGECAFDSVRFQDLLGALGLSAEPRSLVINSPSSVELRGRFPSLRQAVLVPLSDKQNLFGWIGAFGHRNGGEFGSPEVNLLGSVSAILAVHASNIDLYRRQADFLANVVRALTSAIDAKDPYTCGHSDRVARIAVALAADLGCDQKQLDTIYLSGLLHDIGKIGIDDSVLRKTTKLTDGEYEHIKLHTDIGFKILCDLTQLGDVLPVVRHHHEAWNGKGYPLKLVGEQIPLMARIVAVADAFDAMSSDRPYRKGMPDDRLDEILRDGSGKQWDPAVVAAFFRIREQVGKMVRRDDEFEPVAEELRQFV